MADKEYRLGNNARELVRYTVRTTKPVSGDVSTRDVRKMLQKIASLEDIRDVRTVCSQTVNYLDRKEKQGFSQRGYKLFGEDMCKCARQISADVQTANDKHFDTEHEERLRLIDEVLRGCNKLLEDIQQCVDAGYITVAKGGEWTKKVTDVKYPAAAWRKKDGARARKLEEDKQREADARQVALVKDAIRQYNTERRQ